MKNALCRAAIHVALVAAPITAFGHTPQPASSSPATTAQGSCDPSSQPGAAVTSFFMDRILTPGKAFSLAGVPPEMLQKIATMQKQEALRQSSDWPNLCRYQQDNIALSSAGKRPRVVFLGDSITEFWKTADPGFFSNDVIDRGISGQTTPQILLRFYQDVVALHPTIVHIMAGTNDVGGNTGPASDAMIVDNIRAMIDIAQQNGIRVILASITPTKGMMSSSDGRARRTEALDVSLRRLALERHVVYADYYPVLDDGAGAMRSDRSNDGLHPNSAGYAQMRPIAERAITAAHAER